MAEQFRVLPAIAKSGVLLPALRSGSFQPPVTPTVGDSMSSSGLQGYPHVSILSFIHIHIVKNKK